MTTKTRKLRVTPENIQEAAALRALWNARTGIKLSQAEFGETFSIGNQSAVGQFLRGDVPLSLNAAKGFAAGLGCTIGDFSPRLARIAIDAGMHAGEVSNPDQPTDMTSLNRFEMQLVMLYRTLKPEIQAGVLQHVINLARGAS